ncbi:hypothetical protein Daus18300_000422 [Diaporthe australafricana]|uniref:Threonine aspartase n=1 Tax=Diaporthe australafricana TaxID=127596 RepID=A0ABR3Y5S2_9PEZI
MASLESMHGFPSRSWHYGVSLLVSGDVDSGISWQLANFCKADESLCMYLHVVHRDPDPDVEGGESRSRLVEGELFFIKDWLVAGERLFHYPFPHLKCWPNHEFYRKCLAWNTNPPAYDNIQDRELFEQRLSWKFRFADNRSNAHRREYSNEFPVLASSPNIHRAATASERHWNADLASLSTSFNTLQLSESESDWPSSSFSSDLAAMDSRDPNQGFFGALNPSEPSSSTDTWEDHLGVGANGAVDRYLNKRVSSGDKRPSMAVFVHAGAGYHSIQNENLHLTMCSKAAQAAMKCMKGGGSATDAIEAAITVLEDNEITNAGYGSNLSIDGTVECDATIVDHLGRSGACGAVPNIKNPISLAKLVLDSSLKSMTLRRLPPNMLVGEGAKKFALEHGMALVKHTDLISKNARDRFKKWCEDIRKAQTRVVRPAPEKPAQAVPVPRLEVTFSPFLISRDEKRPPLDPLRVSLPHADTKASKGLMRDHTSAVLTGMWNEGQPDSPSDSASPGAPNSDPVTPTKPSPLSAPQKRSQTPTTPGSGFDTTGPIDDTDGSVKEPRSKRRKTSSGKGVDGRDGVDDHSDNTWEWVDHAMAEKLFSQPSGRIDLTEMTAEPDNADNDKITDTIGAIAIDGQGNIAAGSSSGGIGMKHIGRVGPAALVGIGTAVIPCAEDDEEKRAVATVTSGTGEHMATTMAAHKCAERLYQMTAAGERGDDLQEVPDEGTVMSTFVTDDFMGHPGVKNQTSAGAIGVLAVKVTAAGIYMHWAHNTDSFALAHMASYHKEPKCVMSRLSGNSGPVNIGAQKVFKDHAAALKSAHG